HPRTIPSRATRPRKSPPFSRAGPEGGGERGGAARQAKESRGDPRPCCGCRFPLLAALGQLALGAAVAVLGFLMAGVSSSLLVRDTPYWAGLLVSIAVCFSLRSASARARARNAP
uniref:Sarcospan n=1 Tax=Podarcis muralis TaxID=64176 RepID=A0A670JRE0_PODMU